MDTLDAESRFLLEEILPQYTPTPEMPAHEKRALALALGRRLQGEPPRLFRILDRQVPTEDGLVPIRLYYPLQSRSCGWMLWIHGGGFTTGGLDTHDTLCRRLALLSEQVVISVDYRLAPEFPYPAALMDCFSVLRWLRTNAAELSLDPARAAIGGSSAGGNLAAAVTLLNRDRGEPPVLHQVLVYPFLDATMVSESYSRFAKGYQLTTEMMKHYLESYLGRYDHLKDPYLSPIWAADHAGLPPAHIVVAELDPLADDAVVYAEKLGRSGVPVEVSRYHGVMHGFFAQAGALEKARLAQERSCKRVMELLQPSSQPAS